MEGLDAHDWQTGEAWDAGWAYFDRAWDIVLHKLQAALEI